MKQRALLSVADKTGLIELAEALVAAGWEIISTGGTLAALQAAGIAAVGVETVTASPEMLGGRVKTLHPKIHAGILARRDVAGDMETLAAQKIVPIDLVAVNLYPFAQTIAKPGVTLAEAIEQIDIGGPTMVRAAAKNHASVSVLTRPDQYDEFIARLAAGTVDAAYRFTLARAAFAHTADYDTRIAAYLAAQDDGAQESFPAVWPVRYERQALLRYGENPHQQAAFYRDPAQHTGLAYARQLHGKELSYNNLADTDAAWQLVTSLLGVGCAIIKHTNPCGTALGATTEEAFARAFAADDVSAYGGIVACNTEIDLAAAKRMRPIFFEVIIAPHFTDDARALLSEKKNLRLLEAQPPAAGEYQVKTVSGGLLVQQADTGRDDESTWEVVTDRAPTEEEYAALRLAWTVVRHVKSNAIVVSNAETTLGVGAGQMNRVGAANIALAAAGEAARGAALASDAFFPFGDTVEAAAAAGITAIIQPGGSIRDAESIEAANAAGIAMVCTGRRHFRHG